MTASNPLFRYGIKLETKATGVIVAKKGASELRKNL